MITTKTIQRLIPLSLMLTGLLVAIPASANDKAPAPVSITTIPVKKPLQHPKHRQTPSSQAMSSQHNQITPSTIKTGMSVTLQRAKLFNEWKSVKKSVGKKTFLVILNEPNPENVENVVFISAGQQTPNPGDYANTRAGYPNVLTGQLRYYKAACKNKDHCTAHIKPDSLADRLYHSSQFPRSKTLFILVFDSQFNHTRSNRVKTDILNAFWELLTRRFYSGKVKKIVLAGQSKGGCLAFSLAKRFRNTQAYQNIPLIVQGYDPVCRTGQLQSQGKRKYFSNPLKNQPEYKSMYVNMDTLFPPAKRQYLALLDIHSGAPVLKVLFGKGVHSFTFKPNDTDLGWWKQRWVTYEHTDMGGNMAHAHDTVIPGFQHILKYSQQFANYHPPGGGVINTGASSCPFMFPKDIGKYSGKSVCMAKLPKKISAKKCSKKKGMQWQSKYCLWGKKTFWHARPLKPKENGSGGHCPPQLPRKVDSKDGKSVCMALTPAKIKPHKCTKKGGMRWNGRCLWGKGSYWHARPLKGGGSGSSSGTGSNCPGHLPKKLGIHAGKAMCTADRLLKIKERKCTKKGGSTYNGYCLLDKGNFYKARPLK